MAARFATPREVSAGDEATPCLARAVGQRAQRCCFHPGKMPPPAYSSWLVQPLPDYATLESPISVAGSGGLATLNFHASKPPQSVLQLTPTSNTSSHEYAKHPSSMQNSKPPPPQSGSSPMEPLPMWPQYASAAGAGEAAKPSTTNPTATFRNEVSMPGLRSKSNYAAIATGHASWNPRFTSSIVAFPAHAAVNARSLRAAFQEFHASPA
jgi:hypothetical protein